MSSSTSRLQLTKLADSENFSNTVLNANWDKVDNGYGTLNSQIGAGTEVVENILSTIADTYTNIQTSDARIVYVKHGIFHSLQLKFKTSAAITSGSVSLPSSVTGSLSEVEGALSSLDGYGGMVQVVGTTLYIRCGASSTNFLFGQVNWIR